MGADSGRLSRHHRGGFPRRWQGGAEGEKGKPRPLAAIGFFAPTRKNGPTSSVDGIGIALTGRGCPVPPQGRGRGPATSSYADGFAVGPAVAWCSGSAVIVTGATGIAGSDAGKKKRRQQGRDANRRHQQSREGRLDHRDRQRVYRAKRRLRRVTDHTSARRPRSVNIRETWTKTRRRPPFGEEFQPRRRLKRPQAAIRAVCIVCGRLRR